MTGEKRSTVIMLGPSLDSRGGMATVVNGYINAGIRDICDFEYIETTRPGGVAGKAFAGISAYARFRKDLPGCDVVHLHLGAGISPTRKSLFAKAAKRAGKAVVIHEHSGVLAELYREGGDDFARKTRELYELADVAVVLSEEWKDFFAENVCDPSKVVVLHNSVPAPADAPALGREEKVLFLGHMTDVKGPDVLVKAIPEVVKSHPACRFIFAGDGDAQPYRDLAEEFGVLGSCEFVGWVADREKDDLLRGCPIYCQPSRNEGMPMALLEAMGYGRACIATRVGGVPQVVDDGRNGVLVDSLDYERIGGAIVFLLENREVAEEIGKAARLKVRDDFAPAKNIERLSMLYEKLTREKTKR